MNNFIKKRFALSELGAKNFCKGMYWTVALDIVLMLPAVFVFLFLDDWLHPILDSRTTALLFARTFFSCRHVHYSHISIPQYIHKRL